MIDYIKPPKQTKSATEPPLYTSTMEPSPVTVLAQKLPDFDASWDQKIQLEWFDLFHELVELAGSVLISILGVFCQGWHGNGVDKMKVRAK